MTNSLIPLADGSFTYGSPLDAAAVNAVPLPPQGPTTLPEEPSTLALGFVGIGIVAVYAGLQRWRRPSQPAARHTRAASPRKQTRIEPPKRGAA